MSEVIWTNLIQASGKIFGAIFVRNVSISRMIPEELGLGFQGVGHCLVQINVLLTTVNNTNKAQFQGINASSEYIKRIGTSIHKVKFCEHANGATTLRVYRASKF